MWGCSLVLGEHHEENTEKTLVEMQLIILSSPRRQGEKETG